MARHQILMMVDTEVVAVEVIVAMVTQKILVTAVNEVAEVNTCTYIICTYMWYLCIIVNTP